MHMQMVNAAHNLVHEKSVAPSAASFLSTFQCLRRRGWKGGETQRAKRGCGGDQKVLEHEGIIQSPLLLLSIGGPWRTEKCSPQCHAVFHSACPHRWHNKFPSAPSE